MAFKSEAEEHIEQNAKQPYRQEFQPAKQINLESNFWSTNKFHLPKLITLLKMMCLRKLL